MRYDTAGNLVWDAWTNPSNASRDLGYDAEGKIGIVKDSSGTELSRYIYDPDGQRVRRIIKSGSTYVETWQVYGLGGELLAEYAFNASASSPQKEYGYRGGEMLVITETQPSFTIRWLVTDHLGTPRIIADLSGSLTGIKRHDYLPFGEEVPAAYRSSSYGYVDEGVRQQYTGYERDDETGLDYAQARFFSSIQGRFTSPDPLLASAALADPQSWNRYSYVGNRPTVITDPSGLIWVLYNNRLYWSDLSAEEFTKRYGNIKGWRIIDGQYFYASASVGGFVKNGIYFLHPSGLAKFFGMIPKPSAAVQERIDVGGQIIGVYLQAVEIGIAIGTGGASEAALITLRYVIKQAAKEVVEEIVQEAVVSRFEGMTGRRGKRETRDQLDKIRDQFLAANPEYNHVAGGRDQVTGSPLPEEYIPGDGGGRKGSSFPDLTFEGPDGSRIRINTVDVYANGSPTKRERNALYRIFEKTGEAVVAIGKRK